MKHTILTILLVNLTCFLYSQKVYSEFGISGIKEINAEPVYKPHPVRYSYNLSIRSGVLIDSIYSFEAVLGYSNQEYQFEALLVNSYMKGFETGIGIQYFPLKFKSTVTPKLGLNVLHFEQNGKLDAERVYNRFYKGLIINFDISMALKINDRISLIPCFTTSYLKPTYNNYSPDLGKTKINYYLKFNLFYFFN